MAGELDGATIEIPCPNCRHKSRKTIGWLKTHNEMTCTGCGTRITLESSDFRQGMRKVDASLGKLSESFKKLGR